jgi:hypothetical protein
MVTKRTPTKAAVEETAARRRITAKARAVETAPSDASAAPGPAARMAGKILEKQRALIGAGLRAVIPKARSAKPGTPSWPMASLEDVFDRRIAAALQRLGSPTSEQFEDLTALLDQAIKRLDALEKRRGR